MRRMLAQADMEGKSLYVVSSRGSLGPDLFLIGLAATYRNNSGSFAIFAAVRRASPGTGRRSKPISVPRPLPGARIAVTDIGICDRRWSNNYGAEDRTGPID